MKEFCPSSCRINSKDVCENACIHSKDKVLPHTPCHVDGQFGVIEGSNGDNLYIRVKGYHWVVNKNSKLVVK